MAIKCNKALVTGGAGFIGSELVRQIVGKGINVTVVDNLINGKQENIEGLGPLLKFEIEDIRNTPRMEELMSGVDIVFHLACLGVRHSIHSPKENHEVNASATLSLLETARKAGIKRFVYVSSSEIYGTAKWVPMTEEHPAFPMTVYGASKLAGECYTRAYYKTYNYSTVVVRPFNSYGPRSHHEGDSGEVIPKFLLRCMADMPMILFGDGKQTRDFTYVSDTAKGIFLAGITEGIDGETINIGNGNEISIGSLSEEIKEVLARPKGKIAYEIPRPGDVLRLYADTSKANKLLGFKPEISLNDGLSKLRDWYMRMGKPAQELLQNEKVKNWEK
ncbi:NAD-dependent epimerase/dehydratase [Candidatus Omnitrophus magneticus]|uniref:NAD-dependent epimerase/dehydratase n=1 Tax=Candidatus Omnitrophus magneticus TaxID=1609969 RepID=A0A0F0CM09_9BACT|nr:NAD-dependent epimerase/dehydratase [Candidatus Omnitrophus magneticus]